MLEDIERIEVISGPGATLWGANAVNGVINVITPRRARHARARWPRRRRAARSATAAARYGGTLADGQLPRLCARACAATTRTTPTARRSRDAGRTRPRPASASTGAAAGTASRCRATPIRARSTSRRRARDISGMNLLGALDAAARRRLAPAAAGATTTARDRDQPGSFQRAPGYLRLRVPARARALRAPDCCGASACGSTATTSRTSAPRSPSCPPTAPCTATTCSCRTRSRSPRASTLTLGAKVETNSYTGAECLPSARLAWQLAPDAPAVERAVARGARAGAHRPRVLPARGRSAVPDRRRPGLRVRGRRTCSSSAIAPSRRRGVVFRHRLPPRPSSRCAR